EIRRRRKNRNRKARAGKNSFPPTPFLFARPSVQFLPREARQSFGILLKKGSSFVQQLRLKIEPALIVWYTSSMQPSYLKEKVIGLRKKGYSYSLIEQKLGVSNSTLSDWLKDVPFNPNKTVLRRIKNGPSISGRIRHNLKVKDVIEIKKLAKKELGKITKRDLWLLGLGLYLGEGSKTYEMVRIINSNPQIIKLAVKWFKEICQLEDTNITISLHLYPDNNIDECVKYWKKETNLPLTQFRKTQIDKRTDKSNKRKRKLPYGTAHLTIISNGNKNLGVRLHRKIMGWIENIFERT
ncbi:MAG: hypothetical protein UU43_C0001G0141, partial [Candidatus Falkowbacteria bacterium GW2011_GWA2_41_14]